MNLRSFILLFLLGVCACRSGAETFHEKAIKIARSDEHPMLCKFLEWIAARAPKDAALQLARGLCLENRNDRGAAAEAAGFAVAYGDSSIRLKAYEVLGRTMEWITLPEAGECITRNALCGKSLFMCAYPYDRRKSNESETGVALRIASDDATARAALETHPAPSGAYDLNPARLPPPPLVGEWVDVQLSSHGGSRCDCDHVPSAKSEACQRDCEKAQAASKCVIVQADPCSGHIGIACLVGTAPPRWTSAEFTIEQATERSVNEVHRPHPSFDCAAASTRVERMICENATLAELDQRLSRTYQKALQTSDEIRNYLKAEQQFWLKQRDDTLARSSKADERLNNLTYFYRERIDELERVAVDLAPSALDRKNDFPKKAEDWKPQEPEILGAEPALMSPNGQCFIHSKYIVRNIPSGEGDEHHHLVVYRRSDEGKDFSSLCSGHGLPIAMMLLFTDEMNSFNALKDDALFTSDDVESTVYKISPRRSAVEIETEIRTDALEVNGDEMIVYQPYDLPSCDALAKAQSKTSADECARRAHQFWSCAQKVLPELREKPNPFDRKDFHEKPQNGACILAVMEPRRLDLIRFSFNPVKALPIKAYVQQYEQ